MGNENVYAEEKNNVVFKLPHPTLPGVKLEDLAAFDRSGHPHNQVGQGRNLGKKKYGEKYSDQRSQRKPACRRHRETGSSCGEPPPSCTSGAWESFCKTESVRPFLQDQEGNLKDWDLKDENPLFPVPSLPPSTFSTLNTGPYFFGFSKIDMFKVYGQYRGKG